MLFFLIILVVLMGLGSAALGALFLQMVLWDNDGLDDVDLGLVFITSIIMLVFSYGIFFHIFPAIISDKHTFKESDNFQLEKTNPKEKKIITMESDTIIKMIGIKTYEDGLKEGRVRAYKELLGIDTTINIK